MKLENTAFLFPGQASQYVGMGKRIFEEHPEFEHLFNIASDIIKEDMKYLMFEGPLEELTKTEFAQPAILLASILSFRIFGCKPSCAAGHSLGEFSALCAGGAIKIENALELVHKRGKFMQEAVPLGMGKMLAVIGAELDIIEKRLEDAGNPCDIANINSPSQFVLSGSSQGIASALDVFSDFKCVELKVSAPFHSRMMVPAGEKLKAELDKTDIVMPEFPVYSNVTAKPYKSPSEIKKRLVEQCYSAVLFTQTIENMKSEGISSFIEVGPGNVLTGLVKRIDRTLHKFNIEDDESVKKYLEFKENRTGG